MHKVMKSLSSLWFLYLSKLWAAKHGSMASPLLFPYESSLRSLYLRISVGK